MTASALTSRGTARHLLNKVPEVTIWFWIIKILCTTVGESFADWINSTLGVGLMNTALMFTLLMAAVLAGQMMLTRYVPGVYWLTVVVLSITGTLYTDITDQLGVPLGLSTLLFAALLTVVFVIWYRREKTLSIHSINTRGREAFYWLAVLVTFALGTATGDWTLELTGWGPGLSILLPLTLIGIVTALWRYGANPVLSFWIAYILTRPLGANIGDFLALPADEQGPGLGTMLTSVIFLVAILAVVVYLSFSHSDVTERHTERAASRTPARARAAHSTLGVIAIATIALLAFTNAQPHQSALADEGPAPSCEANAAPLDQSEASAAVMQNFPSDATAAFRTIVSDVVNSVQQGDQAAATSRITDLETAWDDDQDTLNAADCQAWSYLDHQIDQALTAVRSSSPDQSAELAALQSLLTTLPA